MHVKVVVSTEADVEDARANLQSMLEEIRIGATPDVIVSGDRPFPDILKASSQDADLVFLGAEPESDFASYYRNLQSWIEGLPSTVLILAAEEVAFEDVLIKKETMSYT